MDTLLRVLYIPPMLFNLDSTNEHHGAGARAQAQVLKLKLHTRPCASLPLCVSCIHALPVTRIQQAARLSYGVDRHIRLWYLF